jgi:succinyl-CoA synthetase beta subunit
VLAEGIVEGAREVKLSVPLIVRMEGTNVEQGKQILAVSGLPIISARNMAEAAEKAVAASRG